MKRSAEKILILGVDGMDPRLTRKYINEGYMPNVKKLLEKGAAREDLSMIGGHPTVTPPMWTTLATGASPCVHGISEYYAHDPERLDVMLYNFDSSRCKAEPLWNVAAEAGRKTLVWHWPGSSWPPTSDSPNLAVVDGTQPAGPNLGIAEVDPEKVLIAGEHISEIKYVTKLASDSKIDCFIPGMEVEEKRESTSFEKVHAQEVGGVALTHDEAVHSFSNTPFDVVFSPIKQAANWADAPADAKECVLLNGSGKIRRPLLILKNEQGIYDRVAVYNSKKDTEPIVVAKYDEFVHDFIDDAYRGKEKIQANRNCRLLEIAEDGSKLRMWISAGMDFTNDTLWHPKALLQEIIEHVGYPQPVCTAAGNEALLLSKCVIANWTSAARWNAGSIKYLAKEKNYEMIFSHFHNVDLQGHLMLQYLKEGSEYISAETYRDLFRDVYVQTDDYIGELMELLDEGWTILLVSDHGQICSEHGRTDFFCGLTAVNAIYFKEWGYITMIKDADGNDTHEIDWTKTLAVPQRSNSIFINLKGRNPHGIVEPADQYELEERIMTDMYQMKDPKTGHRLFSIVLRNKDAIVLGVGGEQCGDIVYYLAEGHTGEHGDSLSTMLGTCDTSVASIFIAAGRGIKENHRTERHIKHVDVVPTAAVLAGLNMPAQCEGAPIYQILESPWFE